MYGTVVDWFTIKIYIYCTRALHYTGGEAPSPAEAERDSKSNLESVSEQSEPPADTVLLPDVQEETVITQQHQADQTEEVIKSGDEASAANMDYKLD